MSCYGLPDFKKHPKKEWEKESDGSTYECVTCKEVTDHWVQHADVVEHDGVFPQMRCPKCFSYWFYEKDAPMGGARISQPAKLLRAVEVIFEYLKESESVGGEIDGWENLQKDLKDSKEKALTEMDFLEVSS